MDKSSGFLLKILQADDHKALLKLTEDGGDILNATDSYGQTLLHYTASEGKLKCLEALLRYAADKGHNINVRNNDGITPVYAAAATGQDECLELLAKYGANLDTPEDNRGYAPIHVAATLKKSKCLKILCKHGANVNLENDAGCTAAHGAIVNGINGKLSFLKVLAKYGMDFNIESGNIYTAGGLTALDLAKRYNSAKCAEFLSAL